MEWARSAIREEEIRDKTVLEVGSYNVNGTLKTLLSEFKPLSWTGVDQNAGPNVDVAIRAEELVNFFGPNQFDVVVCTEMLEHAEDWRSVVRNLLGMLTPGGLLILTARGPGMVYHADEEHGYGDYWRFTIEDIVQIFGNTMLEILQQDWELPGFFLKTRKPRDLEDIEVMRIS